MVGGGFGVGINYNDRHIEDRVGDLVRVESERRVRTLIAVTFYRYTSAAARAQREEETALAGDPLWPRHRRRRTSIEAERVRRQVARQRERVETCPCSAHKR